MNTNNEKKDDTKNWLRGQNIVVAGVAWGFLALLFYLLFSIPLPGEDLPFWYQVGTYIFEQVAYLAAAILCFRNWRSPQIVSGSNVWLGFGLGMTSFFLGNLVFGYWELGLGEEPFPTPADFFFIANYFFLAWGMIAAVTHRKLNLGAKQWLIVIVIAMIGIAIAVWISTITPPSESNNPASKPTNSTTLVGKPSKPTPVISTPKPTPTIESNKKNIPEWVTKVDTALEPFGQGIALFYVVGDVFLLILATTLLLAFWGGKFSESWKMIAVGVFCFYIADMYLKYAENVLENYQSGSLPEVGWVFSPILFGIGAGLEYEISLKSSRQGRRKRGV